MRQILFVGAMGESIVDAIQVAGGTSLPVLRKVLVLVAGDVLGS